MAFDAPTPAPPHIAPDARVGARAPSALLAIFKAPRGTVIYTNFFDDEGL